MLGQWIIKCVLHEFGCSHLMHTMASRPKIIRCQYPTMLPLGSDSQRAPFSSSIRTRPLSTVRYLSMPFLSGRFSSHAQFTGPIFAVLICRKSVVSENACGRHQHKCGKNVYNRRCEAKINKLSCELKNADYTEGPTLCSLSRRHSSASQSGPIKQIAEQKKTESITVASFRPAASQYKRSINWLIAAPWSSSLHFLIRLSSQLLFFVGRWARKFILHFYWINIPKCLLLMSIERGGMRLLLLWITVRTARTCVA